MSLNQVLDHQGSPWPFLQQLRSLSEVGASDHLHWLSWVRAARMSPVLKSLHMQKWGLHFDEEHRKSTRSFHSPFLNARFLLEVSMQMAGFGSLSLAVSLLLLKNFIRRFRNNLLILLVFLTHLGPRLLSSPLRLLLLRSTLLLPRPLVVSRSRSVLLSCYFSSRPFQHSHLLRTLSSLGLIVTSLVFHTFTGCYL